VQQQPSARADTLGQPSPVSGQASPRVIAAMQPGLIEDTRHMIDRHHKTMHQAFLAMDKARSRPIFSPAHAPNPQPPTPYALSISHPSPLDPHNPNA
jgi:hypothetical protein